MPNPYSEIFRAPGAKGFAAAEILARMPMAMAPIGIVAISYGLGPALAAARTASPTPAASVLTDSNAGPLETSIPGVFAVGDVRAGSVNASPPIGEGS